MNNIQIVEKCGNEWEELVSTGLELRNLRDNVQYAIGLLALKVAKKYGEDSLGKFAIEISVEKNSIRQWRWIIDSMLKCYSSNELGEVVGNLSMTHLRILAGKKNVDIKAMVEKAIKEDLSVEQLGKLVSAKTQKQSENKAVEVVDSVSGLHEVIRNWIDGTDDFTDASIKKLIYEIKMYLQKGGKI